MRRVIVLAALLNLAAMSSLRAQAIEQVIVTGVKLPQPVGQQAFSVIVLDNDQLAQSDRLDDALKSIPGASLFRRNGSINANATTQGISLRAIAPSGAGRALVLLDGVPVNDPFGGWVVWTALPFEDIESAEVVRGAGTGPYGAGALTGTISLSEISNADGIAIADVSAGSLGTYRTGVSGGKMFGDIDLVGHASAERSDGWMPVREPARGAADNHLWFGGYSGSLRAQTTLGGDVFAALRVGGYSEARGGGLQNVASAADGLNASVVFARAATPDRLGWRLQFWSVKSEFSNLSASISAGRAFATPANDQYATPALGLGANLALLGAYGLLRWEAGADVRLNTGESREHYLYSGGDFLNARRVGGMQTVTGVYAEAAFDTSQWLLTLGLRGDRWSTAQGHLVQSVRATGATVLQADYQGRDGIVPTGRIGVRRNFDDGGYLRVSGYAGFRPPSLNELYRPFRVGNDQTNANAALTPEELVGAEVGWGGRGESLSWNITGFWNRLNDAIANVTIGAIGAGVLRQRQNAGDVNSVGLEGDIFARLSDAFALHGAFSVTDARFVDSVGLDGKRPAQAPRVTITGGAKWQIAEDLALDADVHWESLRYEDDLNSQVLKAALTIDGRATWTFAPDWNAYLSVENVNEADVGAAVAANGVISYAAPRTVTVGFVYRQE